VRLEDEESRVRLVVGMRGGEHHPFADAEFHLARREVGDDDRELADQLLGRIRRLDAAEDSARAGLADVERELEELGRSGDLLAGDDQRDAQVELGEVVDRDRRAIASPPGSGRTMPAPAGGVASAAGAGGSNRASSCPGRPAASGAGRPERVGGSGLREITVEQEQLARDPPRQRRQHRREIVRPGTREARGRYLRSAARAILAAATAEDVNSR
jgi:hypothetical protein